MKTVEAGERVDVPVLSGYKLVQERPYDCRFGCTCERGCNGTTTIYPGTVERVIYWADNSTEAVVACDDGETRRLMLAYPSGDVC